MISEQQRKDAFKAAPEKIQELYDSPLANALNGEMREKYSIPDEKNGDFLEVTGDVILGYNKIAELPMLFQTRVGLDKEAAHKLTSDLIDAWEPIVIREASEVEQKKDQMTGLAEKIAAIKPSEPAPAAQPQATEPAAEQVASAAVAESDETVTPAQPIRTMQTDMDNAGKVHGYGALPENKSDDDEPVVKATSFDDLRKTN